MARQLAQTFQVGGMDPPCRKSDTQNRPQARSTISREHSAITWKGKGSESTQVLSLAVPSVGVSVLEVLHGSRTQALNR